jgi:hypothetical protein
MNTLWMTASSGVGTVVSLGLHGALLTVVLTVVRRHKPAAVLPLAISAIVDLVTTILLPVAYAVVPALARGEGGIDSYSIVFAALSLGATLIRTISGVLLVVGVAKLASPEPTAGFSA